MKEARATFEGCRELTGLAGTETLAADIAEGLMRGDAVALEGDIGAGKTTLARAILRSLGVQEVVPSPTFTLAQRYETATFPVVHYDLYRIEHSDEISELALDEALADGVALIEWPERMAELPASALRVRLEEVNEGDRQAYIAGPVRWAGLIAGAHHATRG